MRLPKKLLEFDFIKKSLKINFNPFSLFGIECGKGWDDLVYNLCKDLKYLGFDGIVTQIKEKYGQLCFYVSSATDRQWNIIEKAEKKSLKICEICGKRGKLYDKGWVVVRCKKCIKE
jgi:hypothetical protein